MRDYEEKTRVARLVKLRKQNDLSLQAQLMLKLNDLLWPILKLDYLLLPITTQNNQVNAT